MPGSARQQGRHEDQFHEGLEAAEQQEVEQLICEAEQLVHEPEMKPGPPRLVLIADHHLLVEYHHSLHQAIGCAAKTD
ncbi:hypothetical protein L3476_09790 [Paenibacillus thiaminolyticus]|uniref:hypothetical protein n=1 Tax=Paenibacillus thiaminolyticus TaxID=49283 RepID=UPI0011639703|nr:hypothetical protein [Paenibacillus thiaminolyticus]NGP58842.1 hypothetical protein [Paenibacillus thiaminolyticus]WCR28982.1 hypothetical protein L3476_09790 [Paenibacillus thiaminolyticus]